MSQLLLLPGLTTWLPRALPSMLPLPPAQDTLLAQLLPPLPQLLPPSLLAPLDTLVPLLVFQVWLPTPMVLWSQLMSQLLLPQGLTIWPLRALWAGKQQLTAQRKNQQLLVSRQIVTA